MVDLRVGLTVFETDTYLELTMALTMAYLTAVKKVVGMDCLMVLTRDHEMVH